MPEDRARRLLSLVLFALYLALAINRVSAHKQHQPDHQHAVEAAPSALPAGGLPAHYRDLSQLLFPQQSQHRSAQAHEQHPSYEPAQVQDASATSTGTTLSDIFLVTTIDGQLHALKRNTGQWAWSLHSEANDTHEPTPLVQSASNGSTFPSELYILEPVAGGQIYVHQTSEDDDDDDDDDDDGEAAGGRTTRLPLTLAELVDMSPFVFPGNDLAADRMFVGSRTTSLVGVDLATGKLVGEFGPGNGWCEWKDAGLSSDAAHADQDDIARRPRDLLYLGKTDYSLSIISKQHGGLVQSLSFTSYHPSAMQTYANTALHESPDRRYFQATQDGSLLCFHQGVGLSWAMQPFGSRSPIISIFDLAFDSDQSASPLLLPHPYAVDSPGMPKGLAAIQQMPDAAYFGLMADNQTPFAMSRSHFPLVSFANGNDVDSERRSSSAAADCKGPQCRIGMRHVDSPSVPWRPSLAVPAAPSRLAIDASKSSSSSEARSALPNAGNSETTHLLPSSEPYLTLPPATQQTGHSPVRMTAFVVLLATVVLLLLRNRSLRKRLSTSQVHGVDATAASEAPSASEEGEQSPASSGHAKQQSYDKDLPPIPPPAGAEEAAEDEDASAAGKKAGGGGRGRRKRGKRPGQKAAAFAASLAASNNPDGTAYTDTALPAVTQVGSLIVSDQILGYGSHGTVVLQGTFQGRAVAVKRLLSHLTTLATHEVTLLQESDEHPNVIRYFAKEQQNNFLYIALEPCPANLADLVEAPEQVPDLVSAFEPKKAMRQIAAGLSHLHKLKIVHRDMKPQNILIAVTAPPKGKKHASTTPVLRMLISDFGLCKKLEVDESSFLQTVNHAAGSFGYRAPEVLRGQVNPNDPTMSSPTASTKSQSHQSQSDSVTLKEREQRKRLGRSLDLFSTGCIFYYILTHGEHPFGSRYEREVNILNDKMSLDRLDGLGEESHEAQHLISSMVAGDAAQRPTSDEVLLHPFFWNPTMRLNFICEASDRFEIMERDPPDSVLVALESEVAAVLGNDWLKRLDPRLVENLGKYRKYDGASVRDLLRVIRNKKHHYLDLPDPVRKSLGSPPEDFLAYFTQRFPLLFLHVWSVIAKNVSHESLFEANYFRPPD